LILGCNFGTRKTRKSIKGSKDLDSSLVSNKNLNQRISSSGWGPASDNLSQNGLKPTPLMVSSRKQPKPKP